MENIENKNKSSGKKNVERIKCECGVTINKGSMKYHLKSKNHLDYQNSNYKTKI